MYDEMTAEMQLKMSRTAAQSRLDPRRTLVLGLGFSFLLGALAIGGCTSEFSTPRTLAELSGRQLTGRFALDTTNVYQVVVTLGYQAQPGECFHLLPEVTVELNGAPMPGTRGFTTDSGGCAIPRFQTSMATLPADPAAHLVIADSSLTLNMDVDDLFGPRSMAVRPPADVSSLTAGQTVWLDLTPAHELTPASGGASMIDLSFTRDGQFTPAFELDNAALMISGATIGFAVPDAVPAGAGTLDLWTIGAVPVSRCDGADVCDVQGIYERKLAATVAAP